MKRACLLASALALAACSRSHSTAKPSGPSSTTWHVTITDGPNGPPIAARVYLFNDTGDVIHIGKFDLYGKRQVRGYCTFADDVLGTWDGIIFGHGKGEVPIGNDACAPSPAIPYGHYHVQAWRDLEHDSWQGDADLSQDKGTVATTIVLTPVRARPADWLVADLHVHAEHSNDSTMPNTTRVFAQVAAGVQVIGLANHDFNDDANDAIHADQLDGVAVGLPSAELSSDNVHMGVYPVLVQRGKDHGGAPDEAGILHASPKQLFDIATAIPGAPLIQINHPRFRVTALFDSTGWIGVKWPPPFPTTFDAVEVLNGFNAFNVPGDRRFDEVMRDFYTLTDHGVLVAPMGNSDTHQLNSEHDATARTYVDVPGGKLLPFDQAAFVQGIRTRHVWSTSGPLLQVKVRSASDPNGKDVGPGQAVVVHNGTASVDITLDQANFVVTDNIRVWVGSESGPKLVTTITVPHGQRHFQWQGPIDVGAVDTWIGIDANGATPLPVELTGSYPWEKGRNGDTPCAAVAPILIDADGDNRWKRGDADRPIDEHGDVIGR